MRLRLHPTGPHDREPLGRRRRPPAQPTLPDPRRPDHDQRPAPTATDRDQEILDPADLAVPAHSKPNLNGRDPRTQAENPACWTRSSNSLDLEHRLLLALDPPRSRRGKGEATRRSAGILSTNSHRSQREIL